MDQIRPIGDQRRRRTSTALSATGSATLASKGAPQTIERVAARATSQSAGTVPGYVTEEQVQAITAACDSTRDRLLIRTLWFTGGRVSEVVALRRDQIDERNHALVLVNLKRGANGGGAMARKTVYVPPAHVAELRQFCNDIGVRERGYVFGSRQSLRPGEHADASSQRGPHLSRFQAWRIVQTAATRAGVYVEARDRRRRRDDPSTDPSAPPVRLPTPLDFRHGVAIWLLSAAATPIARVAEHLGHASVETTMTYLRLRDPDRRDLMAGAWSRARL